MIFISELLNIMTLSIKTAQHTYSIVIATDLLQQKSRLRSLISGKQVFILTDENIAPHYLDALKSAFSDIQCDTLVIPSGEIEKNIATFEKVLTVLLKKNHHRDTTLIALGGGVICDLTGFVAACFMRGVDYIQIPTTLLAQVDASIGGKTEINHQLGKNLIGSFHQPKQVLIDLNTLNTLSAREFNSGFAEIIKAALIYDADFFNWLTLNVEALLTRNADLLKQAITRACEIKTIFVTEDERDHGKRQHLNFGHTIGHALEQVLGLGTWLHGEAVALGMLIAAKLSIYATRLTTTEYQKIFTILMKCNLVKKLPKNMQLPHLTSAMQHDKKIKNNQIQFILLDHIGRSFISTNINEAMLQSAWQEVTEQISMELEHAGSITTEAIFSIAKTNDAGTRQK